MIKKIYLISILLFLVSCGGVEDAGKVLRNEKISSNDEFMVEKKDPLVFPPGFSEIPEPGSSKKNSTEKKNGIKSILKADEAVLNSENKSRSVEESILNKIRK
jgi:hypothetical protein